MASPNPPISPPLPFSPPSATPNTGPANPRRHTLASPNRNEARDDETWIDFLRGWTPPANGQDGMRPWEEREWASEDERQQALREHQMRQTQLLRERFRQSEERRRSFASGQRNAVDTTNAQRPLPNIPQSLPPLLSPTAEVVLPPWQPDADVSECPICHLSFSFWFRKHHCRKCGRVVCTNCSPHRITIPRQFIVQPPNIDETAPITASQNNTLRSESLDVRDSPATSQRRRALTSEFALGGGEEVRICNPCVPDPNTSPPPQPGFDRRTHLRTTSLQPGSTGDLFSPSPGVIQAVPQGRPHWPGPIQGSRRFAGREEQPDNARSRRVTQDSYARPMTDQERFFGVGQPLRDPNSTFDDMLQGRRPRFMTDASSQADQNRRVRFDDPEHSSNSPPRLGMLGQSGPSSSQLQYHHLPYPTSSSLHSNFPPGFFHPGQQWSQQELASPYDPTRPSYMPQRTPQPAPPESEVCPVCHRTYRSLHISSNDTEREAHVAECLAEVTSPSPNNDSSSPPNANPFFPHSHNLQQQGRRPLHNNAAQHKVNYVLDEKEAQAMADSGTKECVICMDEFSPGQEMARLECMCRFHRQCIDGWFGSQNGGGGRCPVHLHW